MNGLFITGTDTGVGKTHVTCAIAKSLRPNVLAMKPIATGATWAHDRFLSDDTCALAEACDADYDSVTQWSFPQPVAPAVAARLNGVSLTIDALTIAVRKQIRPGRRVLVEGVGGLLCPLTDHDTVADWIVALSMPTIIVARRSLGTLNHTLLTLEVAKHRGLKVRGVVISETAPVSDLADETNVEELRRRIDVPILAVLPYQSPGVENVALNGVDWLALMTSEDR